MKIAIVDYGSGNLRSVSKAIEKIAPVSTQVLVTGDPEEVLKADRVVFPGQGAMPDCMKNLRTTGMEEAVRDAIRNKPFFAVCVGEQMLFEHSEEGDTPGLGIFPGDVGNLQHLVDGIVVGHADAVLAASIFHFGEYTIEEAKRYMQDRGIPVRLD